MDQTKPYETLATAFLAFIHFPHYSTDHCSNIVFITRGILLITLRTDSIDGIIQPTADSHDVGLCYRIARHWQLQFRQFKNTEQNRFSDTFQYFHNEVTLIIYADVPTHFHSRYRVFVKADINFLHIIFDYVRIQLRKVLL